MCRRQSALLKSSSMIKLIVSVAAIVIIVFKSPFIYITPFRFFQFSMPRSPLGLSAQRRRASFIASELPHALREFLGSISLAWWVSLLRWIRQPFFSAMSSHIGSPPTAVDLPPTWPPFCISGCSEVIDSSVFTIMILSIKHLPFRSCCFCLQYINAPNSSRSSFFRNFFEKFFGSFCSSAKETNQTHLDQVFSETFFENFSVCFVSLLNKHSKLSSIKFFPKLF